MLLKTSLLFVQVLPVLRDALLLLLNQLLLPLF
jgi:hypothetical protein